MNPTIPPQYDTMRREEIRGLISKQFPVTLEGSYPFTMFGMVDKMGLKIRKDQSNGAAWSAYTNAQPFLREVENYRWRFSRENWTHFLAGLGDHCTNEYSTENMMRLVINSEDPLGPVDYNEVCREIRIPSTVADIATMTRVIQMHPRNTMIRNVGLGVLAQMYKFQTASTPDAEDMYEMHVALAIEILLHEKRDAEPVKSAILILVAIQKIHAASVRKYVSATGHDIMWIVFGVLDVFSGNKSVVSTCDAISQVFLPTWQAPPPSAATAFRLPIDIIFDYMRQNSGCRVHLRVGSQQLHDLSQKNFDTVAVSHTHMRFVLRLIDDINMRLPPSRDEKRVFNLWTFLHLCVGNQTSLCSFRRVFRVDVLLQSLRYFMIEPYNMIKRNSTTLTTCITQICEMVMMFVNEPHTNNMEQFLEADAISTFMETIVNQRHHDRGQLDTPPCAICIEILLRVFENIPEIMFRFLCMPSRNGQIIPLKFSYGVEVGEVGHNQTLHGFLVDGLRDMLNKDIMVFTDPQHMTMVENSFRLLLEISQYWDLVRDDVTNSLSTILVCAHRCMIVFKRSITTARINYALVEKIVHFRNTTVQMIDAIVFNYMRGMPREQMLLEVNGGGVRTYMAKTAQHRASNALLLAFVNTEGAAE